MNKKIDSLIILLLIVILVIICIAIFARLTNNHDVKSYQVLMPIRREASNNMNYCLKGCVRGSCKLPSNNPDTCKYDFQCNYCQDPITNMFYVDFNQERKIVPPYKEQKKLTISQDKLLNKEIEENNEYIKKLNKQIISDNKDYELERKRLYINF